MTEIVTAKDGNLTIKKDGVFLISGYRPVKEIERLIPEQTEGKFFIVFGSALGYFEARLMDRGLNPECFRVFEPDSTILNHPSCRSIGNVYTIKETHDLANWIESRLVQREKPQWIAAPGYVQNYQENYQQLQSLFKESLHYAVENLKVTAYFSKLWHINFFRNLSKILSQGTIHQLGFNNKANANSPILIIASGPSLDKQLKTIKKYSSKLIILCVLSAARSLIAEGIYPQALVISDAGVGNKLHFSGIPENIPILASVYANSALLSTINNPIVFYDLDEELNHPTYQVKYPSVTIDAGMIAKNWTHEKLIFSGLDLAYPTSGGSHIQGNAIQDRIRFHSDRLHTVQSSLYSFLKRNDLLRFNGGYTHAQFQLVRESVDQLFPGALVIGEGISFKRLYRYGSLDQVPFKWNKLPIPSNPPQLSHNPLSDVLKNKLKKHLNSLTKIISDGSLESRFYIRESLSDSKNRDILRYYRRKVDFLKKKL